LFTDASTEPSGVSDVSGLRILSRPPMSDLHAYRKIVHVQQEIVALSRQNATLEEKCKRLQAELIVQHKRQTARKRLSSPRRLLVVLRRRVQALPNELRQFADRVGLGQEIAPFQE
jgi:hypothetical protein